MKGWRLAGAMIGAALFLSMSGQVSADPTCTTYDSTNGTETYPGTYVGIVSGTCQIGNLNDSGQGNALVNSTSSPSIYEFQLTSSGSVTITDQLGNNGIDAVVDVELYALAGASSTSPSGAALASITIPVASGGTGVITLYTGDLSAGYYAIDTYLASGSDPRYQEIITEDAPSAPEIDPANSTTAIALFGGLVLVFRGRRRKESATC